MHLEDIKSPEDIRGMSEKELEVLAGEIRQKLISTVSRRGGHLASNLGIVELTLALHRVFHAPEDKLIFDVGHQSYVHKLLTGRYARFDSLRSFGGLSGFPKRSESPYDVFETGHASTAISAALGMARARDYQGKDYQVVAVVGDGALTGGLCYEALNDAGSAGTKMIVILNDNEMSISRNVGALSKHLTNVRVSHGWVSTKKKVEHGLQNIPGIGKGLTGAARAVKNRIKSLFVDEGFFGTLGFHYFGPISGYDIPGLEKTLRLAKDYDGPVVIHVLTKKGFGYEKAEEQPEAFHGTPPFYVETGDVRKKSPYPAYGKIAAEELISLAEGNPSIVAITAAMASGTGLAEFGKQYPKRLLDVGIAEEHAVTMAAGMAAAGMHPYFAVYATFFQRSYDQLIHDVCMQNLPVTFLIDRAGLVGEDGQTHHGIFDLAETLPVPNLTILAPRDISELRLMVRASAEYSHPLIIRYGRESADLSLRYPVSGFRIGLWEQLEIGSSCAILAVGSMVPIAVDVHDILEEHGLSASVVNCSTLKPLDEDMLHRFDHIPVFTLEEHMLAGGFGSMISTWCNAEEVKGPALSFGIPDTFVQHGRRDQLMKYLGLDAHQIAKRILFWLEEHHEQ